MTHAEKGHETFSLDHETTSKMPSKSSQPPLARDNHGKIQASLWDRDGRIYLAKYYRTQITAGPATFISVLALVSSDLAESGRTSTDWW